MDIGTLIRFSGILHAHAVAQSEVGEGCFTDDAYGHEKWVSAYVSYFLAFFIDTPLRKTRWVGWF